MTVGSFPQGSDLITNWYDTDLVTADQMNGTMFDLYQKLAHITQDGANGFINNPGTPQGMVMSMNNAAIPGQSVQIYQAPTGGAITLGDATFRFPDATLSPIAGNPNRVVFGRIGNGSNNTSITPAPGYNGTLVAYYTISDPAQGDVQYLVTANYKLVTSGTPLGNNAVQITTISNGIAQINPPAWNYLISTAATSLQAQTGVLNTVAITPATVNQGSSGGGLVQNGRLGLVSGNPYADNQFSNTLYFSPTKDGNLISLYNNSANVWQTIPFNEISQTITPTLLAGGNIYDVYIQRVPPPTTSPIAFDFKAWANNTPPIRNNLNGKLVKSDGSNNLFVGSVYVNNFSISSVSLLHPLASVINFHPNGLYAYVGYYDNQITHLPSAYKVLGDGSLVFFAEVGSSSDFSIDSKIIRKLDTGANVVKNHFYQLVQSDPPPHINWQLLSNDGTYAYQTQYDISPGSGLIGQKLTITPDNNYLYATVSAPSSGAGFVYQYKINADGSLSTFSSPGTVSISVGNTPTAIKTLVISGTTYVYITNKADNTVTIATVSTTTPGQLSISTTFNPSGQFAITNPNDIVFTPNGQFAYIIGTDKVLVCSVTLVQTPTSPPVGYLSAVTSITTASGTNLLLSKDGNYLYCGNTGTNIIYQFRVNSDGSLSQLPQFTFTGGNFVNITVSPINNYQIYMLTTTASSPYSSTIQVFYNNFDGTLKSPVPSFSSWTGQRYLYNYYNQIRLGMRAYISGVWGPAAGGFSNMNLNSTFGQGRLGLLVDPTMQGFRVEQDLEVVGEGNEGNTQQFSTTLAINSDTTYIHPVVSYYWTFSGGSTVYTVGPTNDLQRFQNNDTDYRAVSTYSWEINSVINTDVPIGSNNYISLVGFNYFQRKQGYYTGDSSPSIVLHEIGGLITTIIG